MANPTRVCLILIVLTVLGTVKGRWLELNSSEPIMISDGVHDQTETVPFLSMGVSGLGFHAEKRCEVIYGFLPCADTTLEGIFLIVMYSYVLMLGEDWLKRGSAALLVQFGDMKIAGSVFRVLTALPRVVIMIVSGVLATQSDARGQVASGFAIYSGSTVISLTGIWGVNVILRKEKFRKWGSRPKEDSPSTCSQLKNKLSVLADNGVYIKKETRFMAFIMLLSLIPFAVVLLVQVYNSRMMIFIALVVSVLSLCFYISYQIAHPWIQNMSLAYLKEEHFQKKFLYKLQQLTHETLYDSKGEPNIEAIRSIFSLADLDETCRLTSEELEKLVLEKLKIEEDEISLEYAKGEILRHFDIDGNNEINAKEFEEGCTKWLLKWNIANEEQSQNLVNKLVEESGLDELAKIERVMPRILYRLLKKYNIVNSEGQIDESRIENMFQEYDINGDGKISCYELEKAIANMDLDNANPKAIAEGLMVDFDTGHGGKISKQEFINGLENWIKKATDASASKDLTKAIRLFAMGAWDPANTKEEPKIKILYAVLGIATIYVFAGPFTQSIIQFSNSLQIPFLFTSFVVAPFFMNARSMVIFVFSPASRQTSNKNASLTFSELYGGLVMNNLMGLATLLTIVYVRKLTWDYTAEVVTIIMIGGIMGVFGITQHKYPLYASIVSFILYGLTISVFCVYAWDRE